MYAMENNIKAQFTNKSLKLFLILTFSHGKLLSGALLKHVSSVVVIESQQNPVTTQCLHYHFIKQCKLDLRCYVQNLSI